MISTGINIEEIENCKQAFISETKDKLSATLREECLKLLAGEVYNIESVHEEAFKSLISNGISTDESLKTIVNSLDPQCKNIYKYTYFRTILKSPHHMWGKPDYIAMPISVTDNRLILPILNRLAAGFKGGDEATRTIFLQGILSDSTTIKDNIKRSLMQDGTLNHILTYTATSCGGYLQLDDTIPINGGEFTTVSALLEKPSGTNQYASVALLENDNPVKAIFITTTLNMSETSNSCYISHLEIDIADDNTLELLKPALESSELWKKLKNK